MTYVLSDVHGEYQKFLMMLEKINFTDDDVLFVLGDLVDRGDEPIALIKDLMSRSNVYPTMGNHDFYAYDVLSQLAVDITDENADTQVTPELMNQILEWMMDGGASTLNQFRELPAEERAQILEYIASFPYVEIVEIGDMCYVMSHAGLGNCRQGKKLKEYTVFELIASRPDPETRCFEDETIFVVCGHTPTMNICGEDRIYKSNGNIFIDCGAVFGGRLGCLCLETMEEFYIK